MFQKKIPLGKAHVKNEKQTKTWRPREPKDDVHSVFMEYDDGSTTTLLEPHNYIIKEKSE